MHFIHILVVILQQKILDALAVNGNLFQESNPSCCFPFGLHGVCAGFCEGMWLNTLVNEAELMRSLLSVLSLHIWIKQEWVPSDQGKLALRLKSFALSSPSEISVVISFSSCLLWVSWLQTVSGSSSCVQCWRIGLNALNMVIYQTAAECLTAFLHIFKAECLTSAVFVYCDKQCL